MLSAGEKCLIAFPFTGPFGLGDLIARAVERLGAIPVKAGFGQTWGELVITTIGADAMPLIRYRTGDFTRILPLCPCGGVTKRLDTVSRREEQVSMEELDSVLFRLPGLVDYRARLDGKLHIEARTTQENMENTIQQALQLRYAQLKPSVSTARCCPEHRPMYLGKRYLEKN